MRLNQGRSIGTEAPLPTLTERLSSRPLVVFARRFWWILGLVAVVFVTAWWWIALTRDDLSGPTSVHIVEHGDVENLVAVFGTIQPNRSVEVGAQVSGQLEKLHVWEGKEVGEGDLVAEIDATVQRSRVEERRASLRAQEAQLVSHRSKLELARANAERQTRLLAEDATSQASFDTARDQLVAWESNLVRLESEIARSRASLASEDALLGYSRIHAPIAGTVIEVRAVEGQTLIATQQTPVIMVIAELGTMLVEASVPEADISSIQAGMETYLLTVGGGMRQWETVLGQILPNPNVDDVVVRYTTLFRVDNSDGSLLPNMTARVFIVTSAARNVLTVPYGALSFPGEDEFTEDGGSVGSEAGTLGRVRLEIEEGVFELRNVRVGVTSRISAEILSGLEEGDRVAVGSP